jgi:hypothetical protein
MRCRRTFALQRTIDDLEVRAIVATDHDPDLGSPSAVEYRTDIGRLAGLLGPLGYTPAVRIRNGLRWCGSMASTRSSRAGRSA